MKYAGSKPLSPSQCVTPPEVLTSSPPGSRTSACQAPHPGCSAAAARSASSAPGASSASGLRKNSSGAEEAAAPSWQPAAKPRLPPGSSTVAPAARAVSALPSVEALSTTTSSSPSRIWARTAARLRGSSRAL
jgi:hypothetical protein